MNDNQFVETDVQKMMEALAYVDVKPLEQSLIYLEKLSPTQQRINAIEAIKRTILI